MKPYLLVLAGLILAISTTAQAPDYQKDLFGMWDGAGFAGPQKDIILGKINFGIMGLAKNGGFKVTVTLNTPAQRNKGCDFIFEATSVSDLTILATKTSSLYPGSSSCRTGIDENGNLNTQDVPICFETLKVKFVRKNTRLFVELLLTGTDKSCESKIYFWKSSYTQDELNVMNLFVDYQSLQRLHDSVSKKTGVKIDGDNGAFDQQYIRDKINNKAATMEYFAEDELLLVRHPYLSTFALHLTADEYIQVNKAAKIKFTNSIVNKDEMSLVNAMITGLADSPIYFPDKVWYQKNKLLLQKYTPTIVEKEPAFNGK